MPIGPDRGGVRIAELVATLSYAADLGLGQPMEHCLRQTVIALRLAELVGADADDREATYYLGLLSNAYCHADASEQAKWFGDDISIKADGFEFLAMNAVQMAALILRKLGSHGAPKDRLRRLATFPGTGQREVESWLKTHTALGAQFAERVGLGAGVSFAILQSYEQWDGKGPRRLRGALIPLPARLVSLSGIVEVIARRYGVESAESVVRKHAGSLLDPGLAEVFVRNSGSLLADSRGTATWDQQLRSEVRTGRLDGDAVGAVLRAAGHRAPARREGPAGLTAREVEVLALLARGHATKEIARHLGVTAKTASNHVEHVYTKLGVGSRAAATLFATQHGLVGSFEPARQVS